VISPGTGTAAAPAGIEMIVVPVGGGSGAAGACVVAKAVRPSIEVIGVQSGAAPAAYQARPAGLARIMRGYWGIEDRLHRLPSTGRPRVSR
jgi:threonine dehydratase